MSTPNKQTTPSLSYEELLHYVNGLELYFSLSQELQFVVYGWVAELRRLKQENAPYHQQNHALQMAMQTLKVGVNRLNAYKGKEEEEETSSTEPASAEPPPEALAAGEKEQGADAACTSQTNNKNACLNFAAYLCSFIKAANDNNELRPLVGEFVSLYIEKLNKAATEYHRNKAAEQCATFIRSSISRYIPQDKLSAYTLIHADSGFRVVNAFSCYFAASNEKKERMHRLAKNIMELVSLSPTNSVFYETNAKRLARDIDELCRLLTDA